MRREEKKVGRKEEIKAEGCLALLLSMLFINQITASYPSFFATLIQRLFYALSRSIYSFFHLSFPPLLAQFAAFFLFIVVNFFFFHLLSTSTASSLHFQLPLITTQSPKPIILEIIIIINTHTLIKRKLVLLLKVLLDIHGIC
jgi:hypothetical protein